MLDYRHRAHAGNFADVHKHLVLTHLLVALRTVPQPFFYLDTHAGAGIYDLGSMPSNRRGQAEAGIGRLRSLVAVPEEVEPYLDVVRSTGPVPSLHGYPGSPYIARHFARRQDRLVVSERVDSEVAQLRVLFVGDPCVEVYRDDGYGLLKRTLPPEEGRGMVLIDPPYERQDEFTQAATALVDGWERWPSGVFALWYPIRRRDEVSQLHRRVIDAGVREVLASEFCRRPPERDDRLNGSGMLVINPPAILPAILDRALSWLLEQLVLDSRGTVHNAWLTVERGGGRDGHKDARGKTRDD